MSYKGKLSAIVFSFLYVALQRISHFARGEEVDFFEVLLAILLFGFSYWCGIKYDVAKSQSEKDELTNVYNRRYISNYWKRKKNHKQKRRFVLAVDCDNFKQINDQYGHSKGDDVLKLIAQVLVNNTRMADAVSRWGGDEFIVIGEFESEKGVLSLIERLKNEVQAQSMKINVPFTVSIGYSIQSPSNNTLDKLILVADKNMYKAKRSLLKETQ